MSNNLIAYVRVSTLKQSNDQQRVELSKLNPVRVFEDVISGATDERPGLDSMLGFLREGDTVVVWRLDRLGRNALHVLQTVEQLNNRGVHVRSIADGVDSSTPTGRMILGVMASLAEYERETVKERVALQREAAKANGVKFGRKPKLNDAQVALARTMKAQKHTGADIAKALGVSRATLYNYL